MHPYRTAILIGLLALTLVTAAAAQPPPLPDHPITGKPVHPTWSYWYETWTKDGVWRARCYADARKGTWTCWLVGLANGGAGASRLA